MLASTRRVVGWSVAAMAACAALAGCQSSPPLTQAQLTALETREVDAPVDEAYAAAASALFDAGYTIAMSDKSAGLLTGRQSRERMRFVGYGRRAVPVLTEYTISVMLRPIDADSTAVRIKTAVDGEPVVHREAIDRFWLLMQRQVLMNEPLRDPAGPGAEGAPAAE